MAGVIITFIILTTLEHSVGVGFGPYGDCVNIFLNYTIGIKKLKIRADMIYVQITSDIPTENDLGVVKVRNIFCERIYSFLLDLFTVKDFAREGGIGGSIGLSYELVKTSLSDLSFFDIRPSFRILFAPIGMKVKYKVIPYRFLENKMEIIDTSLIWGFLFTLGIEIGFTYWKIRQFGEFYFLPYFQFFDANNRGISILGGIGFSFVF